MVQSDPVAGEFPACAVPAPVFNQPVPPAVAHAAVLREDAAGNMEPVKTALYTNSTDANLPTGTVKINNGAAATGTGCQSVTLNLTFTDANGVSLVKI